MTLSGLEVNTPTLLLTAEMADRPPTTIAGPTNWNNIPTIATSRNQTRNRTTNTSNCPASADASACGLFANCWGLPSWLKMPAPMSAPMIAITIVRMVTRIPERIVVTTYAPIMLRALSVIESV